MSVVKKKLHQKKVSLQPKNDVICPEAKLWVLYSPIVTQIIVNQDFDTANM